MTATRSIFASPDTQSDAQLAATKRQLGSTTKWLAIWLAYPFALMLALGIVARHGAHVPTLGYWECVLLVFTATVSTRVIAACLGDAW